MRSSTSWAFPVKKYRKQKKYFLKCRRIGSGGRRICLLSRNGRTIRHVMTGVNFQENRNEIRGETNEDNRIRPFGLLRLYRLVLRGGGYRAEERRSLRQTVRHMAWSGVFPQKAVHQISDHDPGGGIRDCIHVLLRHAVRAEIRHTGYGHAGDGF